MAQSPTIALPKKSTDEVDWTGPIRQIIKTSYGENPDTYAAECAALQRCRQDAVRGAGSDLTAASLLTKYFGQLELLELRFPEIRVSFPWRDAFTSKLTTQTSMAFEKASIIYQIAATHSSIASSQNRSDPEGLKRAYHYFRTCAGMLTYINDNFLHAPSTDLSKDVVKFLVGITLAQANETFYETCIDQRKPPGLVSKIASHTAFLYTGLCEEVKEFMGKGIFDRNWVTLLQIKAKYFTSLTQYQRSLVDTAASKHGEALARLKVAETNAKEAHKVASSFAPYFVTTLSTTLPPDTGTAILELTKAHLALCTEKYTQGQKDNDLIYNARVPTEETLPVVDKISAVTPIPIQEVYGTPEVQKTIGPDLFGKLIPLSVHESASVYSEEKAKLVRAEAEKADIAQGEMKVMLESLGVKAGLRRFKEIVEGQVDDGVPSPVISWKDEVARKEAEQPVDKQLSDLDRLKVGVGRELDGISEELGVESRECEMMRVKFDHRWTMEPSGGPSKDIRTDLKNLKSSLDAASESDKQVYTLWGGVKGDVAILMNGGQLETLFAGVVKGGTAAGDLLDVDNDADDAERAAMTTLVEKIEDRLSKINKIAWERGEVLKDLKEKVQNDDVSHLLLLNRRNAGVEPTLFANELEKFRPYQQRLAATLHAQQATLQEVAQLWKSLKDKGVKGKGAKKWEDRERRVNDLVKRFAVARETYLEVSDGLQKGLQFYKDLTGLAETLHERARSFVSARNREREVLAGRLSLEMRLEPSNPQSTGTPSMAPRLPPPPSSATPAQASQPVRGLDSAFSSMSLGNMSPPPPRPSVTSWQHAMPSAPTHTPTHIPTQSQSHSHISAPPAPLTPSTTTQYGNTNQSTSYGSPFPPPPPAIHQSSLGTISHSSTAPPPTSAPTANPYSGMFNSIPQFSLGPGTASSPPPTIQSNTYPQQPYGAVPSPPIQNNATPSWQTHTPAGASVSALPPPAPLSQTSWPPAPNMMYQQGPPQPPQGAYGYGYPSPPLPPPQSQPTQQQQQQQMYNYGYPTSPYHPR